MKCEIIFKKKYPPKEAPTEENPVVEAYPPTVGDQQAFEKLFKKLSEPAELVPIPEREEKCALFIQLAKEVSKLYCLDTVITRHDSHISVDYSFDCSGCMKYMKPIFTLADDYSFFSGILGREITVSLDYYTHYVRRSGKVIFP